MHSERQSELKKRLKQIERRLSRDPLEDPVFEDETCPFTVYGRAQNARTLLFATKPSLARRISTTRSARWCLILSKFGILSRATVHAIQLFANALALPIGFVGDLDVHDVAAFVALRRALADSPPIQRSKLVYAGVSADWIERAERFLKPGIPLATISVEERGLEKERWEILQKQWPRVRSALGGPTASWLDRGYKVEVEALWNPAIFRPGHFEQFVRYLVSKARP